MECREGTGAVLGCACWPPALLSASRHFRTSGNVGAWVGVLGQALEQRFNAWKITVSGRDGEEG